MTSLELDIKYNRVINEVEEDCKELLEEKEQFLILKVREYWNAVRKFNDKTRSLVQELQKQSFPGSQVQAKYEEIYHKLKVIEEFYRTKNVQLTGVYIGIMNTDKFKGKKNLLLIIDAQKDFVESGGKLFVLGAPEAMKNLCSFIDVNKKLGVISEILLTRDDHYHTHIGMPCAWLEGNPRHIINNYPITITAKQVEDGVYEPRFIQKEVAISYLKAIEAKGEIHHIWPEHCLHGDVGQQFPDQLMNSLKWWSEENGGKHFLTLEKGSRDDAEMYSAFSYADGSMPEHTKSVLNNLAEQNFDHIFVAGVAKDFCVRSTLQDLAADERFKGKLVLLEDCMAAINTKCQITEKLWKNLVENFGAEIMRGY